MTHSWTTRLAEHRRDVREAIVDAAANLVAERGLLAVNMSEIADRANIGRATLYKYFPDIETILRAWHERQIGVHLAELERARERAKSPTARLEAVLRAYARLTKRVNADRDNQLAALLHADRQVQRTKSRVHAIVTDLIRESAERGDVREDLPAADLANYCLYALAAAGRISSKAALEKLVDVILAGLHPAR